MTKRIFIALLATLVILAAAWGAYRFVRQLPQRQEQVATTKVRKSDVIIRAYARGELRAVRSVTLSAPNLFGTVQVTRLAPAGALAVFAARLPDWGDRFPEARRATPGAPAQALTDVLRAAVLPVRSPPPSRSGSRA